MAYGQRLPILMQTTGHQFIMKSPAPTASSTASTSKQLAAFIAKFDPKVAKLIRACRSEMRKLLPTAIELVYDNYNFFVIGYSPTVRPSRPRTGTRQPPSRASSTSVIRFFG